MAGGQGSDARRTVLAVLAAVLAATATASRGVEPAAATPEQAAAARAVSNTLRWLVIESLPEAYEKSDHWGAQHHPLVEKNLKFDGLKPRLETRTKQVNHGLWRKYRVTPVEPDKHLQLRVENIRPLDSGRTAFQMFVTARLHTEARQERWRYGVKLLNFEMEADATVEVRLDLELQVKTAPGELVNDIVLEPRVTAAKLQLVDFDLDHLSKIHGDVAKELGKAVEGVVAKELQEREPKLVDKLNKAIAKHQDQLRFSPTSWISTGWAAARDALQLGEPTGND